ncbi:AcrR family transcriptional regulator [Kitasatospora sp. GAS204A]|uniref:TetR/AcrR family transcriptional regulator n=1 Tax=unclassified Kitasatospora TaxID=2633591 RepID=UPI0024767B33|nr:TetR/AcrR family transcriptional regulator [Kitasatospora sp. GAS204B]MDH6119341.1 AcrR family transcriptional regulator [Kitasatospora sp. GAS204B]
MKTASVQATAPADRVEPNGDTMDPRPPAAPSLGRRERNKQRVRERLYTAAVDLFVAKGYEHTSIEDIVERADVARGTFFNYFQRKEDLITAWSEQRGHHLMLLLAEGRRDSSSPLAQLTRCIAVLGGLDSAQRELTVAMLRASGKAGRPILRQPYVAQTFARIVGAGIAQGELRPGPAPEQVGDLLHDLYLGALHRWADGPDPTGPEALTGELQGILRLLLDGIALPAAR